MRCVEVLITFMSEDNKNLLVCVMPMAVYVRDPLLMVWMAYGGLTMSLDQALKELA